MKTECLNCGHSIADAQYCSQCGQKSDTERINGHFLLHEIQHGIIHIDKGIFYTIKELAVRPGDTIREFIEGKRARHFRPLMFLFVLAGIYGFLHHSLHLNPNRISGSQASQITEWAASHYSLTELMILPVFSFSTWLSFRKWDYNYIEHIVLNAFIAGQRLIIGMILLPVAYLYAGNPVMERLKTFSIIITVIITCVDYIQFFKGHSFLHILLRLLLAYLYSILIIILISLPIGLAAAYIMSR